jgi:hypothetical protein
MKKPLNPIWRRVLGVLLAELYLTLYAIRRDGDMAPGWLLVCALAKGVVGAITAPGWLAANALGVFSFRELGGGIGRLLVESGIAAGSPERYLRLVGLAVALGVSNHYGKRPLPVLCLSVGSFAGYLIAAYLSASVEPAPLQTLWIALLAVTGGAIGLAAERRWPARPAAAIVGGPACDGASGSDLQAPEKVGTGDGFAAVHGLGEGL